MSFGIKIYLDNTAPDKDGKLWRTGFVTKEEAIATYLSECKDVHESWTVVYPDGSEI